jgi:hypothetical protein
MIGENAQLLNKLHQRATDLTQALEQADSDSQVLQVVPAAGGHGSVRVWKFKAVFRPYNHPYNQTE